MLRRTALLVGRRVSPLLDAGAPSGRLAALKEAEPLASISRYQPGELRFGLATLYQAFSTSPHAAARKTNGQSQGEQAAEAVQAEPADSASGNQQQQREQDGGPAGDAEPPTIEQLQAQLEQQREDQEAQVADMKDKLLRTLADMENLRERSGRQIDSNKQFAVQSFAKSLLDVADNLERAAEVVPEAALRPDTDMPASEVVHNLQTLLQGVQMTDKQLSTALKAHGVEKYRPVGEQFDPNLHSALFEVPDPSKTPGTVALVSKNGYKLNGRVLRAADVGVVSTPSQENNAGA